MTKSRLFALLAASALLLPTAMVAAQDTPAPTTINFEADADAITPAAAEAVAEFAAAYRAGEPMLVIVEAHGEPAEVASYGADAESYCIGLSQRRAIAVRDALVANGVGSGNITTQAFGCSRPVDDRAPPMLNRRVELKLGPGSGW